MRKDGSISVDFSFSGFLFFSVVLNLCWFVNGSRPISPKAPGWIRKVTASTKWKRTSVSFQFCFCGIAKQVLTSISLGKVEKVKFPLHSLISKVGRLIFSIISQFSALEERTFRTPQNSTYLCIYTIVHIYMFNGEARLNLMIVGLWAQFIPPKPNFGH